MAHTYKWPNKTSQTTLHLVVSTALRYAPPYGRRFAQLARPLDASYINNQKLNTLIIAKCTVLARNSGTP